MLAAILGAQQGSSLAQDQPVPAVRGRGQAVQVPVGQSGDRVVLPGPAIIAGTQHAPECTHHQPVAGRQARRIQQRLAALGLEGHFFPGAAAIGGAQYPALVAQGQAQGIVGEHQAIDQGLARHGQCGGGPGPPLVTGDQDLPQFAGHDQADARLFDPVDLHALDGNLR
ncbi:hypothetical protein D9M70_522010 [compost metagenome]